MKRIDTSTAVDDLFGAGKKGFRDGNEALGILATKFNADWVNQVQEEIANVIELNGIALDGGDRAQLFKAIKNMISGSDIIARFTTTGNIDLNGLATQAGGDWGGALTAGDVIFVKDQGTGSENGWYTVAAGAWARVVYLDESTEVKPSNLTKVSEGATLADTMWMLTTNAPITVGSTALVFVQKDDITGVQVSDFTGSNQSLGSNGYQKLPGGLIIQWGTTTNIAQSGYNAVTFPIAYPTDILRVFTTPLVTATNSNVYSVGAYLATTSGFRATNNSASSGVASVAWLSIGY